MAFPSPETTPPPPPIERPAPDILANFNPELRFILEQVPIERPLWDKHQGFYHYPTQEARSRITIPQNSPPQLRRRIEREELLHAANFEYEPFAEDARKNWQGLYDALLRSYGGPGRYATDPAHAFTAGAETFFDSPNSMPHDIYRYYLPLKQGVLTD